MGPALPGAAPELRIGGYVSQKATVGSREVKGIGKRLMEKESASSDPWGPAGLTDGARWGVAQEPWEPSKPTGEVTHVPWQGSAGGMAGGSNG